MTDRTDELDTLLAKQAIAEALAAYCRGMDLIDGDLARSVFHPDAVADYGAMFSGTGYEFVAFIEQVHPAMEAHHHQIGNITVTVDGDHAGSECYVNVRLRSRTPDGILQDTRSSGRYVDRWERRDGTWRIRHRRYLHHLDESTPVTSPGFPATGRRDREDPSYAALADPSGAGR